MSDSKDSDQGKAPKKAGKADQQIKDLKAAKAAKAKPEAAPEAKAEKPAKVEKAPKAPKAEKPARAPKVAEEAADGDADEQKWPEGEKVTLRLDGLVIDGGTQSRAQMDPDRVERYTEVWQSGEKFPRIDVWATPVGNLVSDGHHRYAAAVRAGLVEIDATLRKGTQRDAILHSIQANRQWDKVGKPRSRADIRKSVVVLLSDAKWSKWPNRRLAKIVGVSHTYVNTIRNELEGLSRPKAAADARPAPAEGVDAEVGSATVDPGGLTADEKAQAAAQLPSEPAPPEGSAPVKVSDPPLTDEEYLDRCPAYGKLAGEAKALFRAAALKYRAWQAIPEADPYFRRVHSLLGGGKLGKAGTLDPLSVRLWSHLTIPGPMEWPVCGACGGSAHTNGKPCEACKGKAFFVAKG